MTDKEKKEVRITADVSANSIKVMAEEIGIAGLQDEAATRLAEDATFRLKQTIQVGVLMLFHTYSLIQ